MRCTPPTRTTVPRHLFYKFTGKERDAESGLDNFIKRKVPQVRAPVLGANLGDTGIRV
jgi:hypothetical protein